MARHARTPQRQRGSCATTKRDRARVRAHSIEPGSIRQTASFAKDDASLKRSSAVQWPPWHVIWR